MQHRMGHWWTIPRFEVRLVRRTESPLEFAFMHQTPATLIWRHIRKFCILLFVTAGLFAQNPPMTSISSRVDVTASQLLVAPVSSDWPSYNGDYTGRRYSALRQINTSNVSQLRAQWVFHAPNSSHLEVTPVAVDGILFVTAANDAYALDAQTGRPVWHYARPITEGLIDDASQHHNRGVAVWHSRI